MIGAKADDDLQKTFTPRSTLSARCGATFGGTGSDFRRPHSRSSEYSNTVSPRFLRGLLLPPLNYRSPEEDRGLRHLLEETPSKYFLDDERYSRRAVLEENVIDAEMLKRIDFFRNLGQGFLDELLAAPEGIRKVVMMPNMVLVREGAPGDSMMVISKGEVEVSVKGQVVKRLAEGSYFGELVFLGAAKFRTATVTTVTFCDVRIIYSKTFKQIAAKYPEVLAVLARFDSRANDGKGSARSKAKHSKVLADTLAGVFRSMANGGKTLGS
eukprot:TRINITY_DN43576_c0_g1_i1.p1 TRINITY_DN43576_c0_g1~~TRINITY_DN43576_c0_g1_i1.p1  ORF type:complete len:269 (-),score=50.47 TRINITY_DN43576_c0_g1_i1:59-865(-)